MRFPKQLEYQCVSDSSACFISDGIDLRKEAQYILNEYAFPCLLRRNYQVHCKCYDSLYKEGLTSCPLCMGTGFVSRIERHMVRKDMQLVARSLMKNMTDAEYGKSDVKLHKFYFNHFVLPKGQDIIYVVTWNQKQTRPVLMQEEFEIQYVDEKRGDCGRIEFIVAFCKSRVLGKPVKAWNIRRLQERDINTSFKDSFYQYDLVW